jgi:hypothetical protein
MRRADPPPTDQPPILCDENRLGKGNQVWATQFRWESVSVDAGEVTIPQGPREVIDIVLDIQA